MSQSHLPENPAMHDGHARRGRRQVKGQRPGSYLARMRRISSRSRRTGSGGDLILPACSIAAAPPELHGSGTGKIAAVGVTASRGGKVIAAVGVLASRRRIRMVGGDANGKSRRWLARTPTMAKTPTAEEGVLLADRLRVSLWRPKRTPTKQSR